MDVWIINGGCKSIFKSSSICLSLAKNENNPKKKRIQQKLHPARHRSTLAIGAPPLGTFA